MSEKCEFCGKVVFMSTFGLTCLECKELRIKHELEKENKRLRAALERIRGTPHVVYEPVRQIAREALK